MTTEEILRAAIAGRRPVALSYDGYARIVCPHVLGRSRHGVLQVLVYQFWGEGSAGPIETPPDPSAGPAGLWRCLVVDRIDRPLLLPAGLWYAAAPAAPGGRGQTCCVEVLAQVAGDPP